MSQFQLSQTNEINWLDKFGNEMEMCSFNNYCIRAFAMNSKPEEKMMFFSLSSYNTCSELANRCDFCGSTTGTLPVGIGDDGDQILGK